MAYTETDQLTYDLNWYFIDFWKRIIHVSSAGGILPEVIARNDQNNDKFHEAVFDLEPQYQTVRNGSAIEMLRQRNIENIDLYFEYFESFARKGLYSFDKFDLTNPQDSRYMLMAYPVYNPYEDDYPLPDETIKLVERCKATVQYNYKNPIDLKNYLRQSNLFENWRM
jgi:hypothetical protein